MAKVVLAYACASTAQSSGSVAKASNGIIGGKTSSIARAHLSVCRQYYAKGLHRIF